MNDFIFPPSLYDALLDAVRSDTPEEVQHRILYHLSRSAKNVDRTKRALTRILPAIIRLRKIDLLRLLLNTLLEHRVVVDGAAAAEAAKLPFEQAAVYLDILFTLGWDVNKALSNTRPPVLSATLHDDLLTHWLLQRGADPNAACDIDFTPLSVAVSSFDPSIIRRLLEHAQHSHNGHLIYHATQREDANDSIGIIRLLHRYNKPIDEVLYQDSRSYRFRAPFLRGSPLYYACLEDRLLVALMLLGLGADVDKACVRFNEDVGPSPRQVAVEHGWAFFSRFSIQQGDG